MKNKILFIPLVIMFCFIINCQQDSQSARDETTKTLLELDRAWSLTTTADDFLSFLADDAIYIAYQSHVMVGKKEWVPWLHQVFSLSEFTLNWEAALVEVRPSGNFGFTAGDWSMTWKDADGKPMELLGSYLAVWERQANGEWKVVTETEDADMLLFQMREAQPE